MERVVVCKLGNVPYREAWDLQKRVQARLIASKRSGTNPLPPHQFLLVEHPHVYTLGKSGNAAHLLLSTPRLAAVQAEFVPIDRGGDITYHGPGQIVGYPILDLERFSTDIHWYLRELEEVVIRVCAAYGLAAGRVEGRTGVWVGPDEKGPERKICAMGIRISRWVTMHGFAFNVDTDLSYFDHIVPCGISDRGVTSLSRELNRTITMEMIHTHVLRHFADRFDTMLDVYEGEEAAQYLGEFLPD